MTSKYENDLIFGKNATEGVVAVEVQNTSVKLFLNDGSTTILPNKIWFCTPEPVSKTSERLEGDLHYNWINEFDEAHDASNFMWRSRDTYRVWQPQEAAMIYHGVTLFKGLQVSDVSVLSFDIETTGIVHNKDSKVLLISNTFREKGDLVKKLFSIDEYDNDDVKMMEEWCKWVLNKDPSIIIGHNIFGFDFPYMSYCMKREKKELNLGRNRSNIVYQKRASKFRKDGSQSYDYHNILIFGRQVIDTMFLSIKYDFARKYESYGLKQIIRQEGLEKQDRQHYDAAQIRHNWQDPSEWSKIKRYAEDDADDALALYDLMISSFFYYTQSIPKTFQQINNSATGSQINSFLVRAYLQHRHSLPQSSERVEYEGAISEGNPGVYTNVFKVDVASLYPSIMITYEVEDKKKDPKGMFLDMVRYFTAERLKNKQLGRETGDRYYKDMEQSQKIFINSAYGLLGAQGLLFNYPKGAADVTRHGREILTHAIDWVKQKGYTLVNCDTDSVSYCKSNNAKFTEEEMTEHMAEINALMDEGIRWEDDGLFKKVIVVGAKNYILDDGKKVKFKGSGLKATSKEKSLKDFIFETGNLILKNKKDQIFFLYNEYANQINNLTDMEQWSFKKTVTKAVLKPQRTNERKVLDAIKHTNFQEGDKVYLFFKPDESLQLCEEFDGNYNKKRLFSKLYKSLMVYHRIIDMDVFPNYSLKKNENLI